MRAGPGLPVGVGRPVAAFALPWAALTAVGSPSTARSWEILTTCHAEGCLRGCSHSLAGVGAALCDDLVGGVLIGLVTVGSGDAAVQVGEGLGVHGVVLAACQRQHGGPGQQQRHVPRALAARGKGFLGAVSKIGHGLTLR